MTVAVELTELDLDGKVIWRQSIYGQNFNTCYDFLDGGKLSSKAKMFLFRISEIPWPLFPSTGLRFSESLSGKTIEIYASIDKPIQNR